MVRFSKLLAMVLWYSILAEVRDVGCRHRPGVVWPKTSVNDGSYFIDFVIPTRISLYFMYAMIPDAL